MTPGCLLIAVLCSKQCRGSRGLSSSQHLRGRSLPQKMAGPRMRAFRRHLDITHFLVGCIPSGGAVVIVEQ